MGSSSTTTQNNSPYAPAQPLINQGLADAQAMYDAGGFNIAPYQGDLVADRTGFQLAADAAAPGAVYGAMNTGGAAQGAALRAMDPYASDATKARVIEDIMPAINSTFANSGMFGSSLHQQNLAKGLSSGLASVEDDAQARALQAAGMVPGLNQAQFGALDYLEGVGGRQQAQSQAEIEAAVFQDQQAKSAELDALQDFLSLSTGAGSQFGIQSSRSRQGFNPLGLLGFGLQAAPFFSDSRLKKNTEYLGQTADGFGWWAFHYNWDEDDAPKHQGVMAQEVERTLPEAVVEDETGFKKVDYSLISWGVAA